jgi:enamine deaminase RidA (YjgF/YER057c/UK114 family)
VDFLSVNQDAKRARLGSDAVLVDGWAVFAGIQAGDLADDTVALPEYVEDQTRKVLANLETLLAKAGLTKHDVVAVRLSLVELPRFYERMNTAYVGFFAPGRLPTRSCVGVTALTRGALLELDAWARRGA